MVVVTGMVIWLPDAMLQLPPEATVIAPPIVPVQVLEKVATALVLIVMPTLMVIAALKVTLEEDWTMMGVVTWIGAEMTVVPVPAQVI
jgi:hypothetical protein